MSAEQETPATRGVTAELLATIALGAEVEGMLGASCGSISAAWAISRAEAKEPAVAHARTNRGKPTLAFRTK